MQPQEMFMKKAIMLSEKAMENGDGGPFGCVVVKDNKVIGEGYNQVISTNDPTAHAEITAIREACKNLQNYQLDGCEIYTSCEPCPMCLGAIYWARPKIIYYGNTREDAAKIGFDDSLIYDEINTPVVDRKIPLVNMNRKEAAKSFTIWAELKDKKKY